MSAPTSDSSGDANLGFTSGILWLICLGLAFLLGGGYNSPQLALLLVSSTSTAFGLWAFYMLGGRVITPSAVLALGHAAMIGYSGVYNSLYTFRGNAYSDLLTSSLLLYGALWCLVYLFWNGPQRVSLAPRKAINDSLFSAGTLLALGGSIAVTRVGGAGDYESGLLYSFAEGAQAGGFVALVAWSAARYRSAAPSYFLAGGMLLVSLQIHSGGGRLRVAVLACAMAAAISVFRPSSRVKLFVLLGAPAMAVALARNRVAFLESGGSAGKSTGFESLVAPLNAFTSLRTASADGTLQLRGGRSFLTPLQQIFPDFMPTVRAFGYEIPEYTNPSIASTSYSDAGYFLGEFVFNFGAVGLLFGILAVGLFLPWASTRLLVRHAQSTSSIWLIVWCLAVGTCLEFAWGGVHLATLRFTTRSAVLIGVMFVMWLFASAATRDHGRDYERRRLA